MKCVIVVFIFAFACKTASGAAWRQPGDKKTGQHVLLNQGLNDLVTYQPVKMYINLNVFISDCSSGKCIDYCGYKPKNLLPGESFNGGCNIIECHKDFSLTFKRLRIRS